MEVALMDMLMARERRAFRQQELMAEFGKPIISFTMNIAGPVKDSEAIRQGFAIGLELLKRQLPVERLNCLHFEQICEKTGPEAFFVVDGEGGAVKAMTCEIEEAAELGRLFDMDVIAPDGAKLERRTARKCLICGEQAQVCARSRSHTVPELQKKTAEILDAAILEWDGERGAQAAVKALLYEVGTTPKPGLVDRNNSGSHRDMDFFTFQSSAAVLYPYFRQCIVIGRMSRELPAEESFARLRPAGKMAEGNMYRATGGVNTHKGAIFSLGILCGALGRLDSPEWRKPEKVLDECRKMTAGLTKSDYKGLRPENAATAGQRLYLKYGVTGVRGQAEAGFPAVREIGLPKLEAGLKDGLDMNRVACGVLLALMAGETDTNLISRSDFETQQKTAKEIGTLLEEMPYPDEETLKTLDGQFMEKNLSPGGSADLLAMTLMLYFLKEDY